MDDETRFWGNRLRIWHVCANAACRRARCCRGNIRTCFKPNFEQLPEGVRDWWLGLGAAQKDGLSFDDAMEWLEEEGLVQELCTWWAAVDGDATRAAAYSNWRQRVEPSQASGAVGRR